MKANDNDKSTPHARYTRPKFARPAEPGDLRPTLVYARSEQAGPIPPGIAFHVETALTQSRMARRTCGDLRQPIEHLDCVIEHLEEIAEKLKRR